MTTIQFPRALPTSRLRGQYFEPEPQEAFAPEAGGRFVRLNASSAASAPIAAAPCPPANAQPAW
jgi:hypothetical protein